MIDANYFEVMEKIGRLMSELDKLRWIINGKPVKLYEKDKDVEPVKELCPCCSYPECGHNH